MSADAYLPTLNPDFRPRVAVAQIGAREHYQVPRMLADTGALAAFHTDYFDVVPASLKPLVERIGGRMGRRALGRQAPGLENAKVSNSPLLPTLWWDARTRFASAPEARARNFAMQGRWFAENTVQVLRQTCFDAFLGFSTAALEALIFANEDGKLSILDAIAPGSVEEQIVKEEQQRYPNWERKSGVASVIKKKRVRAEWEEAQRILVNSNWTRESLKMEGVDPQKIFVVPIAYRSECDAPRPKALPVDRPLRVLWLGSLCLRKGLPYAIEAAKRLQSRRVTFTFAGPTAVPEDVMALPSNAKYIGQVPRIETKKLWLEHDIFLLPTLSDGFAITQIEAIAHGLPVVTTCRCGDVVESGKSGFLVRPYSTTDIANVIERFLDEPTLLSRLSVGAIERSKRFDPTVVSKELLEVVTR